MDEFKLFDEQLEKFQGMLAENGLVGEFRGQKYPIEIEVKRNTRAAMQIGLFPEDSDTAAYRAARLVFAFPIGEIAVSLSGKIELKEKTLNKIKSQAKKLRDLYMQGFFALLTNSPEQGALKCIEEINERGGAE